MDLYNQSRNAGLPAVRPSVLRGNTFYVEHYSQTIFSYLPSTMDVNRSIPLSVTLTLAGGHKVNAKGKLLMLFSRFFSTDQNEI